MFRSARWRLTVWFVAVVLVILVVLGFVVSFVARKALLDGAEDDLRARANREALPLAGRVLESVRRGQPPRDIAIGPAFTAGGYFYALVDAQGNLVASTGNVDPVALATPKQVASAISSGPSFADVETSEGEDVLVYLAPVGGARNDFLLEVGRSIEPEVGAARRLNAILLIGGGAGLLLALGGGYFLAGRALTPISRSVEKQRAFVADASHELRTPLALIRANAEMMRRHPEQTIAGSQELVDDIIRDSDHLSAIVGQMLTLALADTERAPFDRQPVDLARDVGEIGRQIEPLAQAKGITVVVEAGTPSMVLGDVVRLRELLLILVENALKYTPAGGQVRLTVGENNGAVELRVSDTGQGIPKEALPHIFERFYRADKARAREEGSAGLGLAIARWIVEEHEGTIGVESEVSLGTTFTIVLPLNSQAAQV